MTYRSTSLLAAVARDPVLQQALRDDPLKALSALPPLEPGADVWIYRLVVGSLGLVLLVCAIGGVVLADTSHGVPDLLLSLGSAALGALAGLLAPSPRS